MKNIIFFILSFSIIYILLMVTKENYNSINNTNGNAPNNWSNYYECKNNKNLKNWLNHSKDKKNLNDCKKYLNSISNNNYNDSYSKENLNFLINNHKDLQPIYNIFNTEKITPYYNNNDDFYHKMSVINQCKENPFLVSWKKNINSVSCKNLYN